ncbi:MAG: HupE/UreJ family protein [Pseudomonadota bacterium]
MIRALLLCLLLATPAFAHETTRSYLDITRQGADVTATLRVAFRDIEVVVWIDEDLDGQVTWAEATRRLEAVTAYANATLTLATGEACPLTQTAAGASSDGGIDYLELTLGGQCPSATAPLTVRSRLFADIDPDHRLFLTATTAGGTTTAILRSSAPEAVIAAGAVAGSARGTARTYFAAGVEHLLTGPDHIAFLLLLILPAITTVIGARAAAAQILFAVTGFTLAHALTLTAASTALLRPPTDLISGLVAVSIILTAIDNIRPFLPGPRAASAAFFGLIHGYGFATILTGANLSGAQFATALISFNLGIEAAQVLLVLATAFALHALRGGRPLLIAGSTAGATAGVWWLVQSVS